MQHHPMPDDETDTDQGPRLIDVGAVGDVTRGGVEFWFEDQDPML